QVRENELASAIAERQQRLASLQDDYGNLMIKYDNTMSDAAIEEYARTKLGMQKREKFQMEWIEVGEEDDFENDNAEKTAGHLPGEGVIKQYTGQGQCPQPVQAANSLPAAGHNSVSSSPVFPG
ncbi:MAG: hypothetical protein IIY72_05430, partial [Solobacterium sp.]|nr:hypothetical protein [Solobacterium sp.]